MLTRKDLKEEIENAIAQISKTIGKSLENLATKEEIKKLATKEEMQGMERRLSDRIGGVESELGYVKSEIRDLKTDTPTAKEFQNHETRISRLEKTVFAS